MKNTIVLSGRLPMFEGKYTPAADGKKSRINWAMNVQLNTKNEAGYYDEALMNFTAWGYYADQLMQISSLDKNNATRKEFSNITVTGRLVAGYKDKDGNIQNVSSLEVAEFEFTKRLPSNNNNTDQAFVAPQNNVAPGMTGATMPGTGMPGGMPGATMPGGMPGVGAGMPAPGMSMPNQNMAVPAINSTRF